jgi:hypothetical protein
LSNLRRIAEPGIGPVASFILTNICALAANRR